MLHWNNIIHHPDGDEDRTKHAEKKLCLRGFHFLPSGGHKSAAEASAGEMEANVTQRNAAGDRSSNKDNQWSSLTADTARTS